MANERITGDQIGKRVVLKFADGTPNVQGVVYMYCEQPSIGIETDDGQKIHWRADMAEEVGPIEISRAAITDLRHARAKWSPLPEDINRLNAAVDIVLTEVDGV